MKIAFFCPGQGSQTVGMGADLVERFPASRALYEEADTILGWRVSTLSFEPERNCGDFAPLKAVDFAKGRQRSTVPR